jgi:thiol-disulfide isomerase/thioredoxin
LAAFLMISAGIAPVYAQKTEAFDIEQLPVEEVPDTPDPVALLKTAMENAAGHETLKAGLSMNMDAVMNGSPRELSLDAGLILRGEKDFHGHLKGEGTEVRIYSNGAKQSIFIVDQNKYIEQEEETARKDLVAMMVGGPLSMGSLWLGLFLHNDPMLYEVAGEAQYTGQEEIESPRAAGEKRKAHKIHLAYDQHDMDVWLTTGDKVELLKYVIDLRKAMQLPEDDENAKMIVTFAVTEWQPGVGVTEDLFVFAPPEGVEKEDPPQQQEPQKESMNGREAPDIPLNLLDGGKKKLSDHKGKDVVILDFWASWCGPCRRAMPQVIEVAEKFKERSVVLYAVNLAESEEKVKQFLEDTGLEVAVAMDSKRKAAEKYGVQGIPRMIVVGKDGIIKADHTGAAPGLKEELTRELEKILDEKAE